MSVNKYILTINIGNTNITIGLFQADKLILKAGLPTSRADKFIQFLKSSLLRKKLTMDLLNPVIICSVVPRALARVKKLLLNSGNFPIYIVTENLKVPLKNLYSSPKQLGCDRLVNAYAGATLYGAPLIVVDFGTAVTFDVISRQKQYLGGLIFPGIEISLDALNRSTALLPRIRAEKPPRLIGNNTKNSILSGIIYGFSSLTDGLIARLKKKTGKGAKVIATGGGLTLLADYCRGIDKIDPDLTIKGLYLLYKSEIRGDH